MFGININFANSAYALSATTANTIQGTAPYLTFDGGTTQVTTTDGLLGITVIDSGGNGTTYTTSNDENSAYSLPSTISTFKDIEMLVPADTTEAADLTQTIALNDLIQSTNPLYWGDADGDGTGTNGITATGDLQVSITDVNGKAVSRTSSLTGCQSPYKISLKSSAGYIETAYGAPRKTKFDGGERNYYVATATRPRACFAKPNPTRDYSHISHPEWDGSKGFKLQNLGTPSKNFPRTGANGLFFDLTIENATAQSVIDTMSATVSPISGSSEVTLKLTANPGGAGDNVLRVTLSGPSDSNRPKSAFTATEFELKTGPTVLYTFELSKWFIGYYGPANGYNAAKNYCTNLGYAYRLPHVGEYTNATSSSYNWPGLLANWHNFYARAIGNGSKTSLPNLTDDKAGGLFAEWGNVSYYRTKSSGGITSDFGYNRYWTIDWTGYTHPSYGDQMYAATGSDGEIVAESVFYPYTAYWVACVSP